MPVDALERLEPRRLLAAQTIQVTTSADLQGGNPVAGSLRAAILAANAAAAGTTTTISFSTLPAATPIILDGNLPAITAPGTTIDGTTGPGARVEIDGNPNLPTNAAATGTGFVAFDVQANTAVIKGFSLKFCSEAIILDTGGRHATITNNFIGDVNNSGSGTNQIGIEITNGSSNNTIGGTTTAAENVISGNINTTSAYTGTAVLIEDPTAAGTTANIVEGNLIGLTPNGGAVAHNGRGVVLSDVQGNTVTNNQIAGSSYALGALTGNGQGTSTNGGGAGIVTVTSGTTNREGDNTISDNLIGENAAQISMPNQIGVFVDNGTGSLIGDTFSGNTVVNNAGPGFDVLGTDNTISTNTIQSNVGTGVVIATTAERDTISQNSIALNGAATTDLGIDLGNDGVTLNAANGGTTAVGANGLQPYPTITVVTAPNFDTVNLSLTANPDTTYQIEIFGNTAATRSTSNHGQGLTFLDDEFLTTDALGVGAVQTILNVTNLSDDITATATNISPFNAMTNPDAGATSEFSSDVSVVGSAGGATAISLHPGKSLTLNEGATTIHKSDAYFTPGTTTGPYTITVDYGDGTGLKSAPYNSSDFITFTHTYPGHVTHTYTATVTVYNDSSSSKHTFTVSVINNPPHSLTVKTAKGNSPTNAVPYRATAHFLDAGAGNGDYFRVYVDYGDGTKVFRATTQHNTFSITHQYTHIGAYLLTVTVIDDGGGQVIAKQDIDVLTAKASKS